MKKIRILFSVISCLLLASCSLIDFSEDCTYTGSVEVKFDWSNLLEGDKVPGSMDTRFYGQSISHFGYLLSGDTLLSGIPAAGYQVTAFNRAESLEYTGLENIETTKAQLPVTEKKGKLYTVQAPLFYAAKTDIQVLADQTGECLLYPKSCIRQVFMNFILIKEGFDTDVESISGELGGVATGYSFSKNEAIRSSAILAFTSRKINDNNYLAELRVFGMNPDEEGLTEIAKDLELSVSMTDKRIFSENFSLTEIFKDFRSASMYLTLEIRLTAMGMKVSITDWYTVDQGKIEL